MKPPLLKGGFYYVFLSYFNFFRLKNSFPYFNSSLFSPPVFYVFSPYFYVIFNHSTYIQYNESYIEYNQSPTMMYTFVYLRKLPVNEHILCCIQKYTIN